MIIYKTIRDLSKFLDRKRQENQRIGFVPTMGALHAGHISLVEKCRADNEVTVVSIFVNPTQFNNASDLEKYPITIEKDMEMLLDAGVSVLFLPNVKEMYPDEASKKMAYDLGYVGTVYEAAARPGHFDGVALVVKKLLEAVHPDVLYMGQKDFQQTAVVRKLIADFNLGAELVICPIIREADGLAMSSRNIRLSPEARQEALNLSKALFYIKEQAASRPLAQVVAEARAHLNQHKGIDVVYLEIADAETLQPAAGNEKKSMVVLLAATVGGVHLLDNVVIEQMITRKSKTNPIL